MLTDKMKDNNNGDNNRIRLTLGESVIHLLSKLRLTILRNQVISRECQIFIELMTSA